MPGGRRPSDPPPVDVRQFSPAEAERAVNLLQARTVDVTFLDPNAVSYKDAQVQAIVLNIRSTILGVFGENSLEYRAYKRHEISAGGRVRLMGARENPRDYEAERQRDFAGGIPQTLKMLESLVAVVHDRTIPESTKPADTVGEAPAQSNDVFIVHGHSVGPREAVARLLTTLGLHPLILQEQAGQSRTLIEKFERHAPKVRFAVVLLTGDDRGGLIDAAPATYQPRARQNVILELGYFVGKLSRSRVCVLYEEGVEIPTDFHGVEYVPLDAAGAWRYRLADELAAAGFDIDFNRLRRDR